MDIKVRTKWAYYFPPLAAIVFLGVWLGGQQQKLSALEKKAKGLNVKLAAFEAVEEGNGGLLSLEARVAAMNEGRVEDYLTAEGKVDWEMVGECLARMSRGVHSHGVLRDYLSVQGMLVEMDGGALVEGLEEVGMLKLDRELKENLKHLLYGFLEHKHPEKVLELEAKNLGDDEKGWYVMAAFRRWLEKDGVAAEAWLEEMAETGRLDSNRLSSRNTVLVQFESMLFASLLKEGAHTVNARLSRMDEDRRAEVLSRSEWWLNKEEGIGAYATVMREHLPKAESVGRIAKAVGGLVEEDFKRVNYAMEAIEVTEEERSAIVEIAAGKFLRGKSDVMERMGALDEWLEWVAPYRRIELETKAMLEHMNSGRVSKEEVMKDLEEYGYEELALVLRGEIEKGEGK